MNEIYLQLRNEARKLVSQLALPEFCCQFANEISFSRQMLHSDPLLIRLKEDINPVLDDDFGHGMLHSDLVSIDAGAIIQVERGCRADKTGMIQSKSVRKEMRLVQMAGLLHDIKRKEPEHAIEGGKFARRFLSSGNYLLSSREIESIAQAIEAHEAFKQDQPERNKNNQDASPSSPHETAFSPFRPTKTSLKPTLISNALYDADKFRWGPDNFTHTVWDMVMFANVPLKEFVKRYPNGLNALQKIKQTFRTPTGKRFGPNFIDIGITVGNQLFEIIEQKYPDCFPAK